MNLEANRLATFDSWPEDACVSADRIAKAGFYSLRDGQKVECFSCHIQISEWNYGDQVMARHRTLSPACPFVVSPSSSGNVVNTVGSLKDENVRLATFEQWPIPDVVSPTALARAGFYYTNQGDRTKCAFCNGVALAWQPGEDPDLEHKRHFPQCPFVLTTIAQRTQPSSTSSKSSISELDLANGRLPDEWGVLSYNGPKKPEFGTLESRLKSFVMWPEELIQTPKSLSQAGFFYEGSGDLVRCFHCDGGLRHWDPQDDPWTEHARWFPNCSFVKLVKGQDFVAACGNKEHKSGSNLEEVVHRSKPPPPPRRVVTDEEILEQMASPSATAALSIGISMERVKQAIREKLERTGRPYARPDALVEAALNLQHEEDDDDSRAESPQLNWRNAINIEKRPDKIESISPERPEPKHDEGAASSAAPKDVSLEEENRLLKAARLCKICMDSEVGIVFLPCGHLTTCVNCAPNLADCPVCRQPIKATVRTFLS